MTSQKTAAEETNTFVSEEENDGKSSCIDIDQAIYSPSSLFYHLHKREILLTVQMYHPFNLEYCRYYLGSTVRQRVVVVLKGKYKTVDEAEADHGLTIKSYLGFQTDQNVDPQLAHIPSHLLSSISHLGESIFAAGRSFLPARNRTSTRQRFHRFDVGLPPVPQVQ